MSPTFASLSVRNYRIWFFGALVSNIGTWMARVAQDWLVLTELTDHSASALGVVTGLQFLPFLLLAPWAGAVADRFPKRSLLMITQTALGLVSLTTGALVVLDVAQLWQIYVLALLQGITTAFDNPARQEPAGTIRRCDHEQLMPIVEEDDAGRPNDVLHCHGLA